jgi:hypothetical protein
MLPIGKPRFVRGQSLDLALALTITVAAVRLSEGSERTWYSVNPRQRDINVRSAMRLAAVMMDE